MGSELYITLVASGSALVGALVTAWVTNRNNSSDNTREDFNAIVDRFRDLLEIREKQIDEQRKQIEGLLKENSRQKTKIKELNKALEQVARLSKSKEVDSKLLAKIEKILEKALEL